MKDRIVAACVVTAAISAASCATETATGSMTREHQVVELDQSTLTHLGLDMSSGEIDVRGGATKLVEADFTYNVPALKPTIADHGSAGERAVAITETSGSGQSGNVENHWQLAINDASPIDLAVKFGAGDARLTLGSLNLRGVSLSMGAGNLDLDLRGHPVAGYHVSVNGGVGEATIHVSSDVAVSARASGGLGSIDVKGLEQQNGVWTNSRVAPSSQVIDLDVHGGVGNIRILAE